MKVVVNKDIKSKKKIEDSHIRNILRYLMVEKILFHDK